MSVSTTLSSYLDNKACHYDTVQHSFSSTAGESALLADLPKKQVVKAVVVHDCNRYMVAAIPSMNKLMLPQFSDLTGANARLAKEHEIKRIFGDCELGAVPAIAQAFGLEVVWDEVLKEDDDLYIEAGDHRNLIHLKQEQFQKLMAKNPHGEISCAPEELYDLSHC